MDLESALGLRKGDVVVHGATAVPNGPVRVAEVWVNAARTIVLVRLPSVGGAAWLDALGYGVAPEGKKWCAGCSEWHTWAERKEKHPGMLRGASLARRERRAGRPVDE